MERDDIANKFINEKAEHLVSLISSELTPFVNSQLVQHHRQANIKTVETDKELFTLPVNIGMYAGSQTEKRRIAIELWTALKQVANQQNKTVQEVI